MAAAVLGRSGPGIPRDRGSHADAHDGQRDRALRKGELDWAPLAHSAVLRILHNPRYAGVFCFGRRRDRADGDGTYIRQVKPREGWPYEPVTDSSPIWMVSPLPWYVPVITSRRYCAVVGATVVVVAALSAASVTVAMVVQADPSADAWMV
jgi:Recombinase